MVHGALARLFVAIDLPAAEREPLAAWGRDAARALSAHGETRSPPGLRAN